MESLGAELKRAREKQGVSIRDMATRTKISVTALEALERNDVSRLPGGIFGRSFVRSYAVEIGLDPDSIVSRFVEVLEESEREAAERRRAAQPEITLDDRQFLERQRRAMMALRIGLAIGLVAIVALVVWQVRAQWPMLRGLTSRATTAVAPDAPTPAVPAPASAESPAPVAAQPADATAAAPPGSAALVVEFEMTAESAVSVSADDLPQSTRVYRQGERARFEAAQQMLLDVANAGAVRVTINGRPARPLGAAGAHVRTRVTLENLAGFY